MSTLWCRPVSLVFELPLPENLGNSRLHWRRKHAAKKAYWALLDTLVMAKELPRPPRVPYLKCEAEIQMRTWRRMDLDNAHSRVKWLNDFLQSRGYIADDKHLTYQLDLRTATRADLGVTIVLRELA